MNTSRKISIIIFVLLVLALAVAGVWYQNNSGSRANIISYKDPQLTEEEQNLFLKRIDELKKQLNETDDTNEKFKLTMQTGFQYYGLGEYKLARQQYLAASKILPDNATVWAELYVIENAMRDYKNAKKHILKAIELNPSSTQYWRWRIELERDNFAATNETLDQLFIEALEKTGKNIDIITFYAKYLEERKGDLKGAIEQWKQAGAGNPGSKDMYEAEIKRIQNTYR